jgi:hypothetical protein
MNHFFLNTSDGLGFHAIDGERGALGVRRQIDWDGLRVSGAEALVHLGSRLGGPRVMAQATVRQGLALDPLPFAPDGLAGRGRRRRG